MQEKSTRSINNTIEPANETGMPTRKSSVADASRVAGLVPTPAVGDREGIIGSGTLEIHQVLFRQASPLAAHGRPEATQPSTGVKEHDLTQEASGYNIRNVPLSDRESYFAAERQRLDALREEYQQEEEAHNDTLM